MTTNEKTQELSKAIKKLNLFSNEKRLKNYIKGYYEGIKFSNKSVLEIGGGNGILSFFACALGASKVVCIEPELDGSTPGYISDFERIQNMVNFNNITLQKNTFQDYNSTEKYDIIILNNSINHLNEEACIQLQKDIRSKNTYSDYFRKLNSLLNIDGIVIIADCSNKNFWNFIGIKNPFIRNIEWFKHQSPKTWVSMLEQVGFKKTKVLWSSFNRFGMLGELFLNNSFCSYFLTSHFKLFLKKQ